MANGVARLIGKVWNHPANQGRRMRQLAQATAFQVRGRVLGRPTLIRVGQRSRMLATIDSSASILAAYAPEPDYAEWQVWKRFLRPGDLFVDVGANVGTYSVLASEIGAEVIAVEPNADNIERLNANLALNGYTADVWDVALTDEARSLRFSDDLDSMNHITTDSTGQTVRGERFDTLIEKRHVRGMKVDVEGAERQVLQGAVDTLSEGRCDLLQLEWNECARTNFDETRAPLRDLLAEHGYGLYRPDLDGNLHPSDGGEGADMFAARAETVANF